MCWFALVRNMWGFLATSHAPITANENLLNEPYFCLVLLANLVDILRPVDVRLIILCLFIPYTPLSSSKYGTPLGVLDGCWTKLTLFKFNVFKTPSEYGRPITSETGYTFLSELYCTCGTDCGDVIVLLLLSGATLGSWLEVFLVFSSIYGVNQLSLR